MSASTTNVPQGVLPILNATEASGTRSLQEFDPASIDIEPGTGQLRAHPCTRKAASWRLTEAVRVPARPGCHDS